MSTPMPLTQLLQGVVDIQAAVQVTGLTVDSRQVRPGDVYCALAGRRQHGADFIQDACQAGASAVLVETDEARGSALKDAPVPVIAVPGLSARLGELADRFFDHPSQRQFVVGVTGTDGKTSCSHFISQGLSAAGRTCGLIGTLGYGLPGQLQAATHTTPDAIRVHQLFAQMLDQGVDCVAMEVSSHGIDQGRVNGVDFDVAVLTNLTRDHLDYHGSEQAYAEAKRRLFYMPGLRTAVLNQDDDFGQHLLHELPATVGRIGYGMQLHKGDWPQVLANAVEPHAQGLRFNLITPDGEARIQSSLLGRFNAYNLMAVYAVLRQAGLSFSDACQRLSELTTVPGRMEPLVAAGAPLLVVDYAHTPNALVATLSALREHCAGQLWCVFGCGGDRDRGKRPLMAQAATQWADRVIVTDDNPRHEDAEQIFADIATGIEPSSRAAAQVQWQHDRRTAIRTAVLEAAAQDVVLIAGKGHEDYQIVGDQRLPFDDRHVVRQALEERQ